MALVSYNYMCGNQDCEIKNQEFEMIVERSEVDSQICEKCGWPLARKWSPAIFPTHISWSKWRAI